MSKDVHVDSQDIRMMALIPCQRGGACPTGFGGMVSLRTISERREEVRVVAPPSPSVPVLFEVCRREGRLVPCDKSKVGFRTAVVSRCGSSMTEVDKSVVRAVQL